MTKVAQKPHQTKAISVRVPLELLKKLKKSSEDNYRTVSAETIRILTEYFT